MRILTGILLITAFFALAIILPLLYEWLRRKLNKPHIGFERYLIRQLRRDDYVSISGEIWRFSHITKKGESIHTKDILNIYISCGGDLVFYKQRGVGQEYYYPSAMLKCDFIYGKHGLKWAKDQETARQAEKRIKE